ncbi:MAG: hypothetical protein EBS92_03890 [Proteobacteria bacterium]|nr:hypothetical protein [Pseudomonadota bacterium]
MNIFKSVTSLSNSAVKAITNSAMAINYLSGFLSGSARESADPSTTATTAPGGPGAPVGPSAPRGPGAPLTGSSSHRAPSTTNSIPTTLDNIDFDDLKVKLLNEIDILKETSQATPYYERQITKICSLIDEQITQSNNAKTYSYGDIVFNDKGYDGDKTKKSKSETNKFASLRETEKADLYYKHVLKIAIDESFPYEAYYPEIKKELNTIVENWARKNTAQKPTFYNLLMFLEF